MADVALLILRQSTALRYLWCRQCGLQFQKTLPVAFRPQQVVCPGCEMEGFVVGQTAQK